MPFSSENVTKYNYEYDENNKVSWIGAISDNDVLEVYHFNEDGYCTSHGKYSNDELVEMAIKNANIGKAILPIILNACTIVATEEPMYISRNIPTWSKVIVIQAIIFKIKLSILRIFFIL